MLITWPIRNFVAGSEVSFLLVRKVSPIAVQQPIFIDDPKASAGFFFGKTLFNHGNAKVVCNADCGRTGTDENYLMFFEAFSRNFGRASDRSQHYCRGPLDIIIEG